MPSGVRANWRILRDVPLADGRGRRRRREVSRAAKADHRRPLQQPVQLLDEAAPGPPRRGQARSTCSSHHGRPRFDARHEVREIRQPLCLRTRFAPAGQAGHRRAAAGRDRQASLCSVSRPSWRRAARATFLPCRALQAKRKGRNRSPICDMTAWWRSMIMIDTATTPSFPPTTAGDPAAVYTNTCRARTVVDLQRSAANNCILVSYWGDGDRTVVRSP